MKFNLFLTNYNQRWSAYKKRVQMCLDTIHMFYEDLRQL